MEGENKKSNALKIIFWIATLGCFIFGYYNTHLGLRTFNAFGSGNGSWFLAAIPLVMVVGGYVASVKGTKWMLALYLTGEIIFFVFNLTYLYPNYLGRTLVKEEATALKDSLNLYKNKIENKVVVTGDELRNFNALQKATVDLLAEIKTYEGFGVRARRQLDTINRIAKTNIPPEPRIGNTQEERDEIYERWKKVTDDVLETYTIGLLDDKNAIKWIQIRKDIGVIYNEHNPKLEIIINDNSDIDISHEAIENNSQIGELKILTTKLDEVAGDVNSIAPNTFINIAGTGTIKFPKTQDLGTFHHTLISVKERIGKLDTWGVIIICFFFDLLGPFLFYFYLRKDDSEDYGTDEGAFDKPWWKRIFGLD